MNKRNKILCFITALLLLLSSCNKQPGSPQKLTDRLVFETAIAMQIPEEPTYYNVPRENREPWVEKILLQSTKGTQISYSADRLSIQNKLIPFLESMSSVFDHVSLNTTDTAAIIRSHIPYFNRLLCEESWTFSPDNMAIHKKVQGFSLIYHRSATDTSISESLFWIFPDTAAIPSNPLLLCDTIEYNVAIAEKENPEKWWINNIEDSQRSQFLSQLIEKLQSGTIDCYIDSHCRKKTSWSEYEESTRIHTLPMLDENGDTLPDTHSQKESSPLTVDNITAIKFIESWKYDPNSLLLIKTVHAYSPLRTVFDEEGNYKGVEPSVWIKAK